MKDKYLLETIKQEKLLDKFEEYKKMTREEIEYQLGWGDTNEFSWGFAIYLLTIIDKITKYIEENKTKYCLGRDEFTCELKYSDELVKASEVEDILKGEE